MTKFTRTLAVLLCCLLGLAGAPAVQAAPPASKDPNLAQKVDEDEKNGTGRAELRKGHADVGPRITPEGWKLLARDDTKTPPVWRDPSEVLVRVHDQAALELPADKQYDFLGIKPGQKVWVVPQTQNQQVVWLGWNTQDPKVTKLIDRGAKLVLHRVHGPGSFHVFLQNGFDAPQPLWDGAGKDGQEIWVDVNTHVHANWVFEKAGVYLVDFSIVAKGLDGKDYADRATMRFAVGDATPAAEAWQASFPDGGKAAGAASSAAAASSAPAGGSSASASGAATGTQEAGTSSSTGIVVAVVVGLAVIGAVVGLTVAKGRRARREAELDEDEGER